jgi:hypothetical protein
MNMQGFPRDFLLKLKPELEQPQSAAVAPSMGIRPLISSEADFLTVWPRSTDEPGVVEIVIRIKRSDHDAALAGSATVERRGFS